MSEDMFENRREIAHRLPSQLNLIHSSLK
ncbi:hypothetical protein VAE122_2960186 [Vibrio aestuarianus]|nr:hypothetical protein VAE122_2960186 [Vibrio aestuarianus]